MTFLRTGIATMVGCLLQATPQANEVFSSELARYEEDVIVAPCIS